VFKWRLLPNEFSHVPRAIRAAYCSATAMADHPFR
jgi:hypothetical protein